MTGVEDFEGNERIAIVRRLGAGGMGVVYEAFDRERRTRVALKTLRFHDPAAIYRFKNEFRKLADVAHPNLVALHELVSDESRLFFTMELVNGVPFMQWVRDDARTDVYASTVIGASDAGRAHRPGERIATPAPATGAFNEVRVRSALAQLVSGVAALHAVGKLHRDLKPSNVLVTPDGRVVILDFGLVMEIHSTATRDATEEAIAGTAEYMSPEQAAAMELGESTDWYSVGAMLFEALTGRLPFTGGRIKVMMDKQQFDAPRPSSLVPDVPPDLDDLCVALLDRNPARRPRVRAIMRRLGVEESATHAHPITTIPTARQALVGRDEQLGQLRRAFDRTVEGRATTVLVHGRSGMGKTALLRRFLDDLTHDDDVVVLAGRCHERESVPYKALDSLVDALSRYLRKLPRGEAAAVIPRDVHALARVFPVLRRVEAVSSSPRRKYETPDPHEVRRRAFVALREMLARLADQKRVVLWIDDLQWGDVDSSVVLGELVRPPVAAPLLVLVSYRSDDTAASPSLPALRRAAPPEDLEEIEIGPLPEQEARKLAETLVQGDQKLLEHVEAISKESGGSPFFVAELVLYLQSGAPLRSSLAGSTIRLEKVIEERLERLPASARRILDIVAVAGRPIGREIAVRAADVAAADERNAIAVLRSGFLIRTSHTSDTDQLETFHDRIRETVTGLLGEDETKHCHAQLAASIEASRSPDAEALATHFRGADRPDRASEWAIQAGDRARDALAFDRAATWYAASLQWNAVEGAGGRLIRRNLAEALANAGRGPEAARAYLEACKGSAAADALELTRRAAEQFLMSGHIDDGIATIREVLRAIDIPFPETARRALFSLVVRQIRLALRGFNFRERDASQISPEILTRIDACWSIAGGLAIVDNIRGRDFQKRQVLLALDAGEPYRVTRALATEIIASAVGGGHNERYTARVAALAEEKATRVEHPHARAFVTLMIGMSSILEGKWEKAVDYCTRADTALRDYCTGVGWELANAQLFTLWALCQLGRFDELAERLPRLIDEATQKGDLYLVTSLRIGRTNILWLVRDDPARAANEVERAMEQWSHSTIHLQHFHADAARTQTDLYAGRADRAHERMVSRWNDFKRAYFFRIQSIYIEALMLRAKAGIARGGVALSDAARCIRRIRGENMHWSNPIADLLEAGLKSARGVERDVRELLRRAERAFDDASMRVWAAVARFRLGERIGGEEGEQLTSDALELLRAQGVRAPEKFVELYAPGFRREKLLKA
jgi:eukaryotic-like serine/threonine-protein kinase